MDLDTWPGATDRNVSRLTGSFTSAAACRDRRDLQALLGRVLDQAGADERGKVGVLLALVGLLPEMLGAVMSGQQQVLMTTLQEIHTAVEAQMKHLTDSAEDRALGAVLKVFLAIRPLLTGRPDRSLALLEQAEQEIFALPFPPPADASLMVRLAPGCHVVGALLLCLSQGKGGVSGARQCAHVLFPDQILGEFVNGHAR